QNEVDPLADELDRKSREAGGLPVSRAIFDDKIPVLLIAALTHALAEGGKVDGIECRRGGLQHADTPWLLSARRQRQGDRGRRTSDKRDELASLHSITSSARCWSRGGTSRSSAFAVLRLTTSSNLTGTWTGSSFGFSPRRIRSA